MNCMYVQMTLVGYSWKHGSNSYQGVMACCQVPTIDASRRILADVKAAFMGQDSEAPRVDSRQVVQEP